MKFSRIFLIFFCISLFGCGRGETVPPEVKLVEAQELNLWRAEAHLYLPEQYARYKTALGKAKDDLTKVNARFAWFRDYKPVQAEFEQLLKQGEELLKRLETEKKQKAEVLLEQINSTQDGINNIKKLTQVINEGRLSRGNITKAEVILREAKTLYEKSRLIDSEQKLKDLQGYMSDAEEAITPIFKRYKDRDMLVKWKSWAEDSIRESKESGLYSILINKAERKLMVYKDGNLYKTYSVGIGRNGSLDKLHAGDGATPEGKYKIIRKNSKNRYYKALLINYPNDEDRKAFQNAKRNGLLPANAGIGGLIEIHGGGKDGMTYGCVSLDNKQMEELFNIARVGTPVTIIGALDGENPISKALK